MNFLVPLDIGLLMGLVFGWAVLGLAVSFRLFHFPDLTIEGALPLGGAVFAVLVKGGSSVLLAALAACCAGCMAGILTASIHSILKINKFLSGIIVVAIIYSLTLRIMGGANIGLLRETALPSGGWLSRISNSGVHTIQLLLFLGSLFSGCLALRLILASPFGVRLRASGSNASFALAVGLSPNKHLLISLALTNAFSAMAGVLLVWQQGFADVGLGQGTLVITLASLAIGEALVPKSRLSYLSFVLVGAAVGSIIYQIIIAIAVHLGVPAIDLRLATAVLVLIVAARHRDLSTHDDTVEI